MTTRHYVPLSGSPDWAAGIMASKKLMLGEQRRSMGNASFRNDGAVGKVWVEGADDAAFKGIAGGRMVKIYKTCTKIDTNLIYYPRNFLNNWVNWRAAFYVETQNGVTHMTNGDTYTIQCNNKITTVPVVDQGSFLIAFYANSGELLWAFKTAGQVNGEFTMFISIIRTNGDVLYTKTLPWYGFQSTWSSVNFKGSRFVTVNYLGFVDSIVEIYWDYHIDGGGAITYTFGSSVSTPSYQHIDESAGPSVAAFDVLAKDPDAVVTTGRGDLGYDLASSIFDSRYSTGGYIIYGGYDALQYDPRVKFYISHGSRVQLIGGQWVWGSDASVYLNGIKVYGGVKYISQPLGAYNHRLGLAILYFPDENKTKVCNPSVKVWNNEKQEYEYDWRTVYNGKISHLVPMPSSRLSNPL